MAPRWQLPPGVSSGTWDYVTDDRIAIDYDDFFQFNRLMILDQKIVADCLAERPVRNLVDLGCGSGRIAVAAAKQGIPTLAVDLSQPMLEVVQAKADREDLPITCLRANLGQLACVSDHSFDFAVCLFSTLGMIQGSQHRQTVLNHVRRLLRPEGRFILQVHNYWFHLFDPGGPTWLMKNAIQAWRTAGFERGDKFYRYRGLPNMYLHSFTKRELARILHEAGFTTKRWYPLTATQGEVLRWPMFFDAIRASGWIVVCE